MSVNEMGIIEAREHLHNITQRLIAQNSHLPALTVPEMQSYQQMRVDLNARITLLEDGPPPPEQTVDGMVEAVEASSPEVAERIRAAQAHVEGEAARATAKADAQSREIDRAMKAQRAATGQVTVDDLDRLRDVIAQEPEGARKTALTNRLNADQTALSKWEQENRGTE